MVIAPAERAIKSSKMVSVGGHTCIDRYVDVHIFCPQLKRKYL